MSRPLLSQAITILSHISGQAVPLTPKHWVRLVVTAVLEGWRSSATACSPSIPDLLEASGAAVGGSGVFVVTGVFVGGIGVPDGMQQRSDIPALPDPIENQHPDLAHPLLPPVKHIRTVRILVVFYPYCADTCRCSVGLA